MKDWKIYLKGYLRRTIISHIEEILLSRNIFSPTIEQLLEIDNDTLEKSTLSIPAIKEFQLFQQQLRNNESDQ